MKTFGKAMTGLALSLAVGGGAYAAEQVFDQPSVAEMQQIEQERMNCYNNVGILDRSDCLHQVNANGVTWSGCVELGSLVSAAVFGFIGARALWDEIS
jgi:hypothetical protein